MPTLADFFGPQIDLSAQIQKAPYTLGRVSAMKLFAPKGIVTTKAFIGFKNQQIKLVPVQPRGGVRQPFSSGDGEGVVIESLHMPVSGSVLADEVQDFQNPGTGAFESIETLRADKLTGMRNMIEATIEHQRVGALKGLVLDYDGSTVLLDMFATFGITQQTVAMDLAGASNPLTRVIEAERKSEDALFGAVPTGYVALAAPDFMDDLRTNAKFETSLQYGKPSELMANYRGGVTISQTTFVEYRTMPGDPVRIEAGTAYMVPTGIADLLLTRFSPADWLHTVNTVGLPVYAQSEPMPMNKGYSLEAQANAMNICTRPASIIKLTKGA